MTVMTPMEGITAPALRATPPPPAPAREEDDTPLLPSRRQDGWTVPAQRTFLEAIAEGAGVEVACARVGLSTASAYAYRRTAKGAAFALGWRAATLVARDAIAETLLARALEGQVDTIVRGDSVVTRHRHDNRLALALLARLDRQVEAADAGTTRDTDTRAARVVAQEFDAFLDGMARDEGPAQAGLFLARRCGTLVAAGFEPPLATDANADDPPAPAQAPSRTADLAPIYALAAADRFHRTGHATAAEVAVADLDPAVRAGWSAEQWTRADAAGLVAFPAPVENGASPQHRQHSRAHWLDHWDAPVWWDEEVEAWRTSFPPPPFFIGEETGEPDEFDYERALSEEEAAAMGPAPGRCDPATLAARAAARDAFFAEQRGEPLAAHLGNPPAATRSPADDDQREGNDMSIFGSIKKAIFGDNGPLGGQFSGKKDAAPAPAPQAAPHAAPQPPTAAPQPAPAAPAPAPAPAPAQPVDVEQVLTGIAQKKGGADLNWRTSIVDLMKLLDLDSSLANRKELATELGYSGAKDGSAEMNIWLHKAVMRELEKSGGTVPAALKD